MSFGCTQCSATFGRNEHLKRHEASHYGFKNHKCSYCGKCYQRSDVLRRHHKSCETRIAAGIQLPFPTLSGKRKRACDGCAAAKRSCDQRSPCTECSLQRRYCSYQRLYDQRHDEFEELYEFFTSGMFPVDTDATVDNCEAEHDGFRTHAWLMNIPPNPGFEFSGPSQSHLISASGSNQLKPLEFLLNFTSRTGINNAYNYKRILKDLAPTDLHVLSAEHTSTNEELELSLTATGSNFNMDSWFVCDSDESTTSSSNMLPSTRADTNIALGLQLDKIKDLIASALVSGGPEQKTGMRIADMSDVERIFSPEQVPKFLNHFWNRWYPHCPVVHKPTFVAHDAHSLLLMTMILMGACTSLEAGYAQVARRLLDSAEAVVFSHPLLLNSVASSGACGLEDDVPVIQAAYFVSIMQKWEGSERAKERIRRQTFPAFVTAVRSLGLCHAVHSELVGDEAFDHQWWSRFIAKEQLIRVITYLFLLDCSFAIFHNSIPRMVLREIRLQLTCSESCFQAVNPAEFLQAYEHQSLATKTHLLLPDIIRMLCAENGGSDMDLTYRGTSKLNLFLIITTLHSLIFYQRMSIVSLPFAFEPLQRAINRWETLWAMEKASDTSRESSEEEGFMSHGWDFAMLARIHLRRAGSETSTSLRSDADLDGLSHLDQTSMSEVAKLLQSFETLSID